MCRSWCSFSLWASEMKSVACRKRSCQCLQAARQRWCETFSRTRSSPSPSTPPQQQQQWDRTSAPADKHQNRSQTAVNSSFIGAMRQKIPSANNITCLHPSTSWSIYLLRPLSRPSHTIKENKLRLSGSFRTRTHGVFLSEGWWFEAQVLLQETEPTLLWMFLWMCVRRSWWADWCSAEEPPAVWANRWLLTLCGRRLEKSFMHAGGGDMRLKCILVHYGCGWWRCWYFFPYSGIHFLR